MNNIKAVARVKELKIAYIYQWEGIDYEIETPKTELNQGVEDGEVVHIMLSVMPIDKPDNDSGYSKSEVIDDE